MIQAFVNGELSDADHDLMAHHISTCQECAAAVAAERVVRVEMARLTASEDTTPVPAAAVVEPSAASSPALPADTVILTSGEPTGADSVPVSAGADVLSEQVVQSGDVSVPPVPELQLDFILDRTSEGDGMLLLRESVREVSLDQLPPAPVHSVRRTQPAGEDQDAPAEAASARVIYADDMEVAAATMAGIADSVAHGAAALATSGPAERLETEVEKLVSIEAVTETVEPEPIPVEAATATEEAEPPAIEAIVDRPEPLVVEEAPVVEVSEPTAIEDATIIEEQEPAVIQDAAVIGEQEPAVIQNAAVIEEQEPAVTQDADGGAEVDEPQSSQTGSAAIVVPGISAAPPRSDRLWRWGAAAGLLVVAVAAAYAATQVRSSPMANAAAIAEGGEAVSDSALEWPATPSVLAPILDSVVYSRVLDVTLVADSLADSLDAGVSHDPFAGDTIRNRAVSRPARARVRPAPGTRRVRRQERLPQIVSDPPDANGTQARQPGGETLPEVVTGNAPARTTARGSAVVISGVPDVPRLLRTTTHRPRPDVAYVLREYDASAAEPAPRAGVNEYRWSDATGSRLYVLSGPVDVTELHAYARRLQSRDR